MRPKLVLVETNPLVLASDGRESALDLIDDIPLSWNLAFMGGATLDLSVLNNLFLRWIDPVLPWDARPAAPPSPVDRYVGRGYVEKDDRFVDPTPTTPDTTRIRPAQMRYVRRTLELLSRRGIRCALVVTPMPRETISDILNYGEISRSLEKIAHEEGADFIDFNLGERAPWTGARTSTTSTI